MMAEERQEGPHKMLWLLICDVGYANEIYPLYAVSEEEAELKAQEWITRQGARILRRVSLTPKPEGFRLSFRELPGQV